MDDTLDRVAVDLAPQRACVTLAFVLALLSLPGSTLAWELPGGGLWIGLPLGVAAIVLAIRARRDGSRSKLAIAAIAIAALAIGQMAVCAAVLVVT